MPRRTLSSSAEQQTIRGSCETCRVKKIRCPREQPACSKCLSSGRECHYSLQKPMGRPRSTRRATRPQRVLSKHLQTEGSPSAHVSGTSETITSSAGTETPQDLGNESTLSAAANIQVDMEHDGFEVHQCLLDLGNPARTREDIVSESQAAFPPLSTAIQPSSGGCACLSVLYLLLEHLRVKDQLTAPNDFALLRNTIESASDVLICQKCPQRYFSIVQNTALLGVLCLCVAESYHRILRAIDEEEKRSIAAGEKKQLGVFDVGSQETQLSQANTPPLYCVEVSPDQWRSVMRKLVKAEVFGVEGRRDKCLKGFISRLEQRQRRWHQTPPAPDCPPSYRSLCGASEREPTCLKLIDNSKRLIALLEL